MCDRILELSVPDAVIEVSKEQAFELGAFEESALDETDLGETDFEKED